MDLDFADTVDVPRESSIPKVKAQSMDETPINEQHTPSVSVGSRNSTDECVDVNGTPTGHVSQVDYTTNNSLFDSWRYIFNELITRNCRLSEKVMQLEKQFGLHLSEQQERLNTAESQINELRTENQQLKHRMNLLQTNSEQQLKTAPTDVESCTGQVHNRPKSNEENQLDGSRLQEQIIDDTALFISLGLENKSEVLDDNDHYQSQTFFGYLKDKVYYMLGDPAEPGVGLTGDADSESYPSSKVIKQTEQDSLRQPRFSRGENNRFTQKIELDAEQSTIDLSYQRLTDEGLKSIVPSLKTNEQCRTLRLNNNSITFIGASLLADVLNSNNVLQHLSLFHNAIADNGVRSLARILSASNNTLVELHLGDNQITDQGVRYLAEMMKTNRSLLWLNLQSNDINDEGVGVLAAAIEKHNSTIETLFLNSNSSLTDLTVDFLLQMVRNHRSLKNLFVSNCSLSSNGKERLCKAQHCKENLQVII